MHLREIFAQGFRNSPLKIHSQFTRGEEKNVPWPSINYLFMRQWQILPGKWLALRDSRCIQWALKFRVGCTHLCCTFTVMRASSTHVSRAQSVRAYLILRPVYGKINAREQDMQWAGHICAHTHLHSSTIIYPRSQYKMHVCAAPKRESYTEPFLICSFYHRSIVFNRVCIKLSK
jgi:hypothetical protein